MQLKLRLHLSRNALAHKFCMKSPEGRWHFWTKRGLCRDGPAAEHYISWPHAAQAKGVQSRCCARCPERDTWHPLLAAAREFELRTRTGMQQQCWGGDLLATGGQDFQDVHASCHRRCALRLALGRSVCQVAVPACQKRPQALAAICCNWRACHALHSMDRVQHR